MKDEGDVKRYYRLSIVFVEPLLGHRRDYKGAPHSRFYYDGEGRPLLLDRHVMGLLKDAAQALDEVYGSELKADLGRKVFVRPKEILLTLPGDSEVTILDRSPTRPPSAVEERVATEGMTWEAVPKGTRASCELLVYPGVEEAVLRELLEYGLLKGIGLGRGRGYGRFEYELEVVSGEG